MDAKTKLCCLIGNPVGHSLSPLIHNTLAEWMDINLCYTAFCVEKDRVGDAIKGGNALGILGMNVTVPHKCEVIPYLADIDPLAKKIGAVNTLVSVEDGYKGYNTDIIGLRRELEEEQVPIQGREVIILGAGGASKAINFLCADMGATKIYLLNRSIDKAMELANEVNASFGEIVVPMKLSDFAQIPAGKYPVIQTTSVGLHPHDDEAPIMDEAFYEYVSHGVDIIFNPAETLFMKLCKEHGAQTANGLKMLLYQGIAAYELWTNTTVSQEMADRLLVKMVAAMADK